MGKKVTRKWSPVTEKIMRLPLVPFFMYWWLSHPTVEGLEKIMNTVGIVDALMLTLAVGMLGQINYSELRDADDRFLNGNDSSVPNGTNWAVFYWTSRFLYYYGDHQMPDLPITDIASGYYYSPGPMSLRFLQSLMLSTFFFTASLLAVVLLLVFLGMADVDEPDDDDIKSTCVRKSNTQHTGAAAVVSTHVVHAELQLEQWYKYNHFTLAISVISFLVGMVMFFRAMWYMMMIKGVDYHVLLFGDVDSVSIYAWPSILAYTMGGVIALFGTLGCWGVYAVYAYKVHGRPQSVHHAIAFGPSVHATDDEKANPHTLLATSFITGHHHHTHSAVGSKNKVSPEKPEPAELPVKVPRKLDLRSEGVDGQDAAAVREGLAAAIQAAREAASAASAQAAAHSAMAAHLERVSCALEGGNGVVKLPVPTEGS